MSDVAASPSPRLIKRYPNRKLYDTRESRYVTLQQLATLVRNGEELRIVDNATKEDITSVTLAQIVYETEKSSGGASRFSSGALRSLIQSGGEKLMTTLRETSVGKLVRSRSEPAPAIEGPPSQPPSVDASKPRLVQQSREAVEALQRVADHRIRSLATVVIHQLQAEVGRLQSRIAELEAKVRPSDTQPPRD